MSNRAGIAAVILAALGGLLCALLVAGRVFYDYYHLRPLLHHPLIFGVSGFLALAVAWGLGVRHRLIKWAGVVLIGLGAAAVIGLAWVATIFTQNLLELSRHQSPDGAMELVVYEGQNVIDPTWELRVYTKNGLLSRESDVGCVNSDIMTLENIEWVGPRTLRAQLSRGDAVDIILSPSGRPDRRLQQGC